MKKVIFYSFVFFFILFTSTANSGLLDSARSQEKPSPKYALDHIILFVSDSSIEDELKPVFTSAELLQTTHNEQGTKSEFYLFLNANLELMEINDEEKIKENIDNFGSDYLQRWSKNSFGIGIGLKMIPFDTSNIAYPYSAYNNADMDSSEYYSMLGGNTSPQQPMTFIVMPHTEQKVFEDLYEVKEKVDPEIVEAMVEYLTHPTNIKKLSQVIIKTPNTSGINYDLLNTIPEIKIEKTKAFEVILVFDDNQQKTSVKVKEGLRVEY